MHPLTDNDGKFFPDHLEFIEKFKKNEPKNYHSNKKISLHLTKKTRVQLQPSLLSKQMEKLECCAGIPCHNLDRKHSSRWLNGAGYYTRRAEFWITWSSWIRDSEALGNQMGAVYIKRDRIKGI